MAITRAKSKTAPAKADAFIAKAPDAAPKRVRKGNKVQISLTITPALLDRVDALAQELGQSRAAIINLSIHRTVEHGLSLDGNPSR
jgi:hypothetical protein